MKTLKTILVQYISDVCNYKISKFEARYPRLVQEINDPLIENEFSEIKNTQNH